MRYHRPQGWRSRDNDAMRNLLQTLGHSLRMMRKNPGMTAAVGLTLALGIGVTTAIFTVDYATCLLHSTRGE